MGPEELRVAPTGQASQPEDVIWISGRRRQLSLGKPPFTFVSASPQPPLFPLLHLSAWLLPRSPHSRGAPNPQPPGNSPGSCTLTVSSALRSSVPRTESHRCSRAWLTNQDPVRLDSDGQRNLRYLHAVLQVPSMSGRTGGVTGVYGWQRRGWPSVKRWSRQRGRPN